MCGYFEVKPTESCARTQSPLEEKAIVFVVLRIYRPFSQRVTLRINLKYSTCSFRISYFGLAAEGMSQSVSGENGKYLLGNKKNS